jgi:outer membrane lipoprotein-sorting protein
MVLAVSLTLTASPQTGTAADVAATPPDAAHSAANQADIARVQEFLGAITTMTANFLQISPNGSEATGKLYVKRPGRLRFEYDPPVPILIIANGVWFIYYDREMLNATYISQDSTPAWFLVSDDLQLDGEITVTDVTRGPATLRVTLIKTEDPDAGSVTLVFSDDPLELRQWLVLDAKGQETRVSLFDWKAGGDLIPSLFQFNEPLWEDQPAE